MMSETGDNPLRQEFIGKRVKVLPGEIEGVIIDETKNSFVVEVGPQQKRILKNNKTFIINNTSISGNSILVHPEARLKLKWKQT